MEKKDGHIFHVVVDGKLKHAIWKVKKSDSKHPPEIPGYIYVETDIEYIYDRDFQGKEYLHFFMKYLD